MKRRRRIPAGSYPKFFLFRQKQCKEEIKIERTNHLSLPQWGRKDPWRVEDFSESLQLIDNEAWQLSTKSKSLSVLEEGAEANNASFNNISAFKRAVSRAHTEKRTLIIPDGDYYLDIKSNLDSIKLPTGFRMQFSPRARIIWGMQDKYYPVFVIANVNDVEINGANFVWTGKLTCGSQGMDFLDDNGSANFENRFNTSNAYSNVLYCTGILVLESDSVTISNLRGRSHTGDGHSVIHTWISAARVTNFVVDTAEVNDCVLGILVQGGDFGRFSNLSGHRLSQDIGIPGHIIYTFMSGVIIENVIDGGIETGLNKQKQISHSVSCKPVGRADIKGINSKRASGPLNMMSMDCGSISDIIWEDNPDVPAISTSSKVFFVTSESPSNIVVNNIVLKTIRDEAHLISGNAERTEFNNVLLIREDNSTPLNGFLAVKGNYNKFRGTLVQRGTVDAKICSNWNGVTRYSEFNLTVRGFKKPPTVDLFNVNYCDFIIDNSWDARTDKKGEPFQSPTITFSNASTHQMVTNWLGYADGVTSFRTEATASTQVSATFPIVMGVHYVTITLAGNDEMWSRSKTFIVSKLRRHSSYLISDVQPIGQDIIQGANVFDSINVNIDAGGMVRVSSNITGASAQSAPHFVYFSSHRIGH